MFSSILLTSDSLLASTSTSIALKVVTPSMFCLLIRIFRVKTCLKIISILPSVSINKNNIPETRSTTIPNASANWHLISVAMFVRFCGSFGKSVSGIRTSILISSTTVGRGVVLVLREEDEVVTVVD